ncbi:MAG: DUF4340 domain-containing protein [Oscillospiraceae bacterium]
MTNQLKRLLGLLALLLVLVAAVVFFMNAAPISKENEETSTPSAISLIEFPREAFQSAEISNEKGTYTVKNQEGRIVVIDQEQSFIQDLDSIAIQNLADQICSIKASSSFTTQASLSDFGLDPPRVVAHIINNTGTDTLLIGNDAPSNAGIYAKLEGKSEIYLVEKKSVSRFIQSPIDFVEKEITPPLSKNAQVKVVTLSGENYNQPVVIQKSYVQDGENPVSPYKIVSPKFLDASDFVWEKMIPSFFGMTASAVVSYNQNDSVLEEFGLKTPHTIANIIYEEMHALPVLKYKGSIQSTSQNSLDLEEVSEKTLELKASKPDRNGFVYVTTDQLPMIFYVNNDVANWASVPYYQLLGNLLLYPELTILKTLTLTTPQASITFTIEYDKQSDKLKVIYQDKAINEAAFTSFYESVVGVYRKYQENIQSYTQVPALSITFEYEDSNRESDTIKYFPITQRTYQIVINDKQDYITTQDFIGVILQGMENILTLT